MSDPKTFVGNAVKDGSRTGRVVSVTESSVRVAWMKRGVISEEIDVPRDAIPASYGMLCFGKGWAPMATVLSASKQASTVDAVVEDLKSLTEKRAAAEPGGKKHSPYKHIATHGPAAGGDSTRETRVKNKWSCKKSAPTGSHIHQRCEKVRKDLSGHFVKTGKIKNIKIKRSYKLKYNDGYKPWRAKQGW